jgi:hypothetical protein
MAQARSSRILLFAFSNIYFASVDVYQLSGLLLPRSRAFGELRDNLNIPKDLVNLLQGFAWRYHNKLVHRGDKFSFSLVLTSCFGVSECKHNGAERVGENEEDLDMSV